jgi:alanyl-tRNA synthetase
MTPEELRRVEEIVNREIRENLSLSTHETGYQEAVREGAIALFGEKYTDQVRVVEVSGFTSELCGGTHLSATGQIGFFKITGESSIGSGLRRIEAVTGRGAEAHVQHKFDDLQRVGELLSARPGQEVQQAEELLDQLREQRRVAADLQRRLAARSVDRLLDETVEVNGAKVLAAKVDVTDVDALREMCDRFRDKLDSAVVALGAVIDERPLLVVAATQDLVGRGIHAGKLAGAAARRMAGGGGGRPNMAQAGGKDVDGLPEALAAVPDLVAEALDGS